MKNIFTAGFVRGVVYLLGAIGVQISPEQTDEIISVVLALAGVIHLVTKKEP